MKRDLLLATILLGGVAIAQTGKVGIETEGPTETLHVNGTARITELPANGTDNAINTDENGTYAGGKNQTFNAVKTVVVDENGVLGVVDGVPDNTPKPKDPTTTTKIKTLKYAVNSVDISSSTINNSVTCLDNFCVRLNESNPKAGEAKIQYAIVSEDGSDINERINTIGEKFGGNKGKWYGDHQGVKTIKDSFWKTFKTKPNIKNGDMARYTVAMLSSQQLYRVNVSCASSKYVKPRGNVTIYIERMGYND